MPQGRDGAYQFLQNAAKRALALDFLPISVYFTAAFSDPFV
jgi:hypothetical protein